MTANGWTANDVTSHVASDGEDELDVPQCSWGTGFKNASECPYPFKEGEDTPHQQVGCQ
jgi:hypothetical protein